METKQAVEALAALAQETRLEVLRLLVRAGPAGLAAGEISRRLDVPPPTLSFHLRALAQAGLVGASRQGRSLLYAADYARLRGLVAFLTENCCEGPGLRRPAAAEARRGRA